MFPIRRLSAFISRTFLTFILISTILFIIFSLTKNFFKTNNQRFVPVGSHLLEHHHHHRHEESRHAARRVGLRKKKHQINLLLIGIN